MVPPLFLIPAPVLFSLACLHIHCIPGNTFDALKVFLSCIDPIVGKLVAVNYASFRLAAYLLEAMFVGPVSLVLLQLTQIEEILLPAD